MREKNPWIINDVRTEYENPWIRVDHHEVINPAGNPGVYGKVHFKNRAVGVVPISDNGDTWLVGQHRFPLDEYHWEIPMGGAPTEESAEDCAVRELREETGLQCTSLTLLSRVCLSNCITDEQGILYVATGLTEGVAEPEETEILSIKRLPFEEAFQMSQDGRITDALSVLALSQVRLKGLA